MSIKYLNAAFETRMESPVIKFVLISMADYADDKGYCFPAISTIEERTGYSRPTVIKAIHALRDMGILSVADQENIPKKYLKQKSQICYKIEIGRLSDIQVVKELNQLSSLTSKAGDNQVVKELNHSVVKELYPNHHSKPSIEPSVKEISPKGDTKKALSAEPITLTEDLITWGYSQPQKWTREEMQQHFEFFVDAAPNRKNPFKDWKAGFRTYVRKNYAGVREGKRYQQKTREQLIWEQNELAFQEREKEREREKELKLQQQEDEDYGFRRIG